MSKQTILNKPNRRKTRLPAALWKLSLFAMVGAAWAQEPSNPVFEAASVKLNSSADLRGLNWEFLPGGRFTATNMPLFVVITVAYDLPFQTSRVSGGPTWVRSEKYDIQAMAGVGSIPEGSTVKARNDRVRLMLQNLLAERFKLVMRLEPKELPIYAVVVAKGGAKLQKAAVEEKGCPDVSANNGLTCHSVIGGQGRGMHGKAVSVADLASFAESWSDRPIVDKTGIAGLFEVDTEGWAPMRPRIVPPGREPTAEDIAMADPTRPTLFLIFERLGLKMEPQKAPLETFVVEHVERPSEN